MVKKLHRKVLAFTRARAAGATLWVALMLALTGTLTIAGGAQAINTLGVIPDYPVANQAYVKGADASADVNGIDLGSAQYWAVTVKMNVKTNTGTLTVALFMSDAANGTGNVHYITDVKTFVSANTGMLLMTGMGNRSQQYLNIDVTIGTATTYDYEVFATPVS